MLQNVAFDDRLKQFFLKTPGAILKAEDYFPGDWLQKHKQKPAFEMASGSQQREFVSLWALFQQRSMFHETAEYLADMAREIRKSARFTTIVTCTATSKYIMEQLHAALEASEKEKIDIRYFGPYPYHIVESTDLRDLHNHRVLILTDVIGTGKLVSHLASVVEELGGSVAAILAIVVTNADFCAQQKIVKDKAPIIPHRMFHNQSLNTPLPVYNIVDLPGERMLEAVKPPFLVKVDPVSIMPGTGETTQQRSPVEPLIPLQHAIPLVERTNAVTMGFFGSEFRRFSFAFRLNRILNDEEAGNAIWRPLSKIIAARRRPIFVSTFDIENLRFSDFVTRRLQAERTPVEIIYIPQTQDNISISGFFLSKDDRARINGRDIFIVLGTANTSERLRNLISIIASEGPNSITALVLLDRMDLSSAHFVPIVRRLASRRRIPWQGSIFKSQGVAFSCHSVFRFRDYGTNDVARMQDMVNRLLAAYKNWCRTSSFQLLTEHDQKYFLTRRMNGFDFERLTLVKARDRTKLKITDFEIEAGSGDAQLLLLILKCIFEKDYAPLIDYLYLAEDKTLIYNIVALLLTDVSFLKAASTFGALVGMIKRRVRENRYARQQRELDFYKKWQSQAETEAKADELAGIKRLFDTAVETESYLIFALALFGFLDTTNDYDATILEVLGGADWALPGASIDMLPLNFIATMRETRTFWAACMLAFLTDRNFRSFNGISDLSLAMQAQARLNDTQLNKILKTCPQEDIQDVLAAITNVDGLRSELREYNLRSPEEAIRLMHKQLILQPPRHSPAQLVLNSIRNDLNELIDSSEQKYLSYSLVGLPEQKQVQRRLEAGWDQVSILQRIGEAAGELFSNTDLMIAARAPKRVLRMEDQQGMRGAGISLLESDIKELSAILLRIRQFNNFDTIDFDRYNRILQQIDADLWRFSEDSIIPSLCYFIVPLVSTLEAAMMDAADGLAQTAGAGELVKALTEKAGNLGTLLPEHYCLAEPLLLAETFRNVFTNMRHAAEGHGDELLDFQLTEAPDDSDPILGPADSAANRQLIHLDIMTPGDMARIEASGNAPTTLARQKAELRDFGIDLSISRPAKRDGVNWRFTLRSRNDHVKALRRDLARIEGAFDLSAVRHIFKTGDRHD